MEQEADVERLVRQRIRALRLARGWSLDALAARSHLSPSNLESTNDEDVIIRPQQGERLGMTIWSLARERTPNQLTVAKMRMTTPAPSVEDAGVHPGRDWFTVLTGTAELRLGDRFMLVEPGSAAEFSTMIPHAIGAHGQQPAETLMILTQDGSHAHAQVD